MNKLTFTAIIKKVPKGYIGWLDGIPGVNTQGATKKEVKENLKEALDLILEARKKLATKKNDRDTFTETVSLAIAV